MAGRHRAATQADGVPYSAVLATQELAVQHGVPLEAAAAIGRRVAGIVRDAERSRAALIAGNQLSHEGPGATLSRIRGDEPGW